MSLCDYLHDPEHIATALREGIVESLKSLLNDEDITVRQKSTECLFVLAGILQPNFFIYLFYFYYFTIKYKIIL